MPTGVPMEVVFPYQILMPNFDFNERKRRDVPGDKEEQNEIDERHMVFEVAEQLFIK